MGGLNPGQPAPPAAREDNAGSHNQRQSQSGLSQAQLMATADAAKAPSKSLRILYVGPTESSSRARLLMQAMEDLGHRVQSIPTERMDAGGERILERDLHARIMRRMGRPLDRAGTNRALELALENECFDLLWVTKALALHPRSLRLARQLQPDMRTAFYSEDDMVGRHNQSSYFRAGLPLYDTVFTTKSYNTQPGELPALGAKRVVFVDKSFGRDRHRPVPPSAEDRRKFGSRVGFIGTFEEERAELMLRLAENGMDVRVWGGLWPDPWIGRHPRLRVEGRGLWAEDYTRGICNTDINLGFLRKLNRDLQTDRSVEIPACGAFLLAERTDEHQRLFSEGIEAEYYASAGELTDKVRYYLEHSEQRQRIAAAGRERCLASGYSFHDRLPEMLRIAEGTA